MSKGLIWSRFSAFLDVSLDNMRKLVYVNRMNKDPCRSDAYSSRNSSISGVLSLPSVSHHNFLDIPYGRERTSVTFLYYILLRSPYIIRSPIFKSTGDPSVEGRGGFLKHPIRYIHYVYNN